MATEKTEVVIVGVGAAGGILAAELGKAGIKVIGLERGPRLATSDFTPHDELRYFERQELRPSVKRQPVTWRPNTNARAKLLLLSWRAWGPAHYSTRRSSHPERRGFFIQRHKGTHPHGRHVHRLTIVEFKVATAAAREHAW